MHGNDRRLRLEGVTAKSCASLAYRLRITCVSVAYRFRIACASLAVALRFSCRQVACVSGSFLFKVVRARVRILRASSNQRGQPSARARSLAPRPAGVLVPGRPSAKLGRSSARTTSPPCSRKSSTIRAGAPATPSCCSSREAAVGWRSRTTEARPTPRSSSSTTCRDPAEAARTRLRPGYQPSG